MMSGNDGRVTREVSFVLVEIIVFAKQSAEIPGARSSGRPSFRIVAPDICGPTVLNLLHIIFWRLEFEDDF